MQPPLGCHSARVGQAVEPPTAPGWCPIYTHGFLHLPGKAASGAFSAFLMQVVAAAGNYHGSWVVAQPPPKRGRGRSACSTGGSMSVVGALLMPSGS